MTGNFQLKFNRSKLRYSTRLSDYTSQAAVSIFRPSNGVWYDMRTINLTDPIFIHFGLSSDTPVPADYNGDGLSEYAVTRNESGAKYWYFLNQNSGSYGRLQWGLSTDKKLSETSIVTG